MNTVNDIFCWKRPNWSIFSKVGTQLTPL